MVMKHRTKSILIVGLVVVLIASGTVIGYFKKNNKSGGDNLYTEYKAMRPKAPIPIIWRVIRMRRMRAVNLQSVLRKIIPPRTMCRDLMSTRARRMLF